MNVVANGRLNNTTTTCRKFLLRALLDAEGEREEETLPGAERNGSQFVQFQRLILHRVNKACQLNCYKYQPPVTLLQLPIRRNKT